FCSGHQLARGHRRLVPRSGFGRATLLRPPTVLLAYEEGRMFRTARISAAILGLSLIVMGCATNPVSGRREISLVSSADEAQIGKEGYSAVKAEYGLYDQAATQTYVNGVGQPVAKSSHLPDLGWSFTVIDDPAVNVF